MLFYVWGILIGMKMIEDKLYVPVAIMYSITIFTLFVNVGVW